MAIQVAQITGDTVELLFNRAEDHLHVGENLSIVAPQEDRGLIVQIIELKVFFPTTPLSARNQRTSTDPHSAFPAVSKTAGGPPRRRKPPLPGRAIRSEHLAIAKIRRVTDPAWHAWDGWLPTRDVVVTRTPDREMLRRCIPDSANPLGLGKTLTGEPFHVEREALGEVNLIVGAKGSGTSHLAKVIASELIDHGVRCVVFDTTGAYVLISSDNKNSLRSPEDRPVIVRLVVGESLKLGMVHFGLDALRAILRQFGLPRAVAMYFESQVARRLVRLKDQTDANQPAPFLGIEDLIQLAQTLEAEGQVVVGGAILSCLEAIKRTRVFATEPAEAMILWDSLAQIRHGGALVIDLSGLPRRAQPAIVFSLVGILQEIAQRDSATDSQHSLSMFFDDAQPLVAHHLIAEGLIPARRRGLTSFFVTTMVRSLGDNLLYGVDNLFLRHMMSDHEVRHLAKSGLVDTDTLRCVGRGLRTPYSLLIGKATGGYPMIFAINPLGGVEKTSETADFWGAPATIQEEPTEHTRTALTTQIQASASADRSLPLFPDETPVRPVSAEFAAAKQLAVTSQSPTPSVAQVTAMWDHIVTRVARRRRILETILSAARPLRITGQEFILGFPPQHRFQQELVESEEYRRLLEEELKKAFGVTLEVTTEVYPTEVR
jgi:Helicase HerA, central domain